MSFWNTETETTLANLWGEGLSAGKIGKALGVSRNAVIGKAHRMGLQRRAVAAAVVAVKPAASVRVPAHKARALLAAVIIVPMLRDDGAPVTLLSVRDGECRWPVGPVPAGGAMQVCGHTAKTGKPYCTAHAARAYLAGVEKLKVQEKSAPRYTFAQVAAQ